MQNPHPEDASHPGVIGVGTDHNGVALKDKVVEFLRAQGLAVKDFGSNSTASCDYPDISFRVAEAVAAGEIERGILICGTGVGMSISANKVKGARAALCFSVSVAALSRAHNDANILVIAGLNPDTEDPLAIVEAWFATDFSGEERHLRRIAKIKAYEDKHSS
ncbi:MAG: ribose 5-phosphate isomerase B [Planctomycetes bacterium]|nr:ribose 5-phosphate isomerase B [Planctomycetota bacterium]